MAQYLGAHIEGPNLYEQWIEDGVRYSVKRSMNEAAIMAENQAVRSNGGPRRMAWCRPLVQLSETQYSLLVKLNPDLACGDGKIQTAAWRRLAEKFPALTLKG